MLARPGLDPAVIADVRSLLDAHDAAGADVLAPALHRPPTPGDLVGQTVGPWRLTGVLGAGGMGVVYAAERVGSGFDQRAALKRVRPGVGADFHARFLRERALLAGLDHPGVAHLLDGGLDAEGVPYLAMERVDGEPITDYVRARALGLRDRVRLCLQACEAVAHAHRHLVVHRDLKPAHVVVTETDRGEPQVKLLDFGIAKLLERRRRRAHTDRRRPAHAAVRGARAGARAARHDGHRRLRAGRPALRGARGPAARTTCRGCPRARRRG